MSVPALRFKDDDGQEFPEWEEKNISEILKIGSGKDYKKLASGDIPVYGTGGYMLSVNDYLYDGESVCIGRKGTIDKPVLLSGKFWTVDTLFYTHSFVASAPKFIYALFQNIDWKNYNEASGVPSLSKSTIEKIEVFVPSLPEQTKIANFLTAVDDKITLLTKKADLLSQYKKGVMQQIFSQELRFKDDDGLEFPEWEEKTLGEVGNSFNGLTGKSGDDFGIGLPYITYKQIFDANQIDVTNFSFVRIDKDEKQNKVQFGDVFFTTSSETANEVGICSVLLCAVENDVYLNSFCFGYRIKSFDLFSPYFASHFFRSPDFRLNVIVLAQGSTRFNISKINFMKIKIKLPSLPEQNKIANFLTTIDEKITNNQTQLDAVKLYKQGLLQQMFV